MYEIKLSDGTKLKDINLNGDTFVSKSEIKDSVFEGNLSIVEITNLETKEVTTLKDAELRLNRAFGDEWWFVIQEKTETEKAKAELADGLNQITQTQMAIFEIYQMILGGE